MNNKKNNKNLGIGVRYHLVSESDTDTTGIGLFVRYPIPILTALENTLVKLEECLNRSKISCFRCSFKIQIVRPCYEKKRQERDSKGFDVESTWGMQGQKKG